jgi:hypothetical protein
LRIKRVSGFRWNGDSGRMQFNLVAHPATPPTPPQFKVWANVDYSALGAAATVNIWFGIGAPASRFVIPEGEGARTDELWRSTCLEAFLRRNGDDAYREWNFAPSGAWAAYDFERFRQGMIAAEVAVPPYIRMEDNLTWWTLGATITVNSGAQWGLNLTAVLEEKNGTRSYWALAHSAEKPDFHAPDCFVAKLP